MTSLASAFRKLLPDWSLRSTPRRRTFGSSSPSTLFKSEKLDIGYRHPGREWNESSSSKSASSSILLVEG